METIQQHAKLGELVLDRSGYWWSARVAHPAIKKNTLDIATREDLTVAGDLAAAFLEWLSANESPFLDRVAYQIANYDLVVDESVEEPELRKLIRIDSVNIYGGHVHVWIDTSGATTDHLVHVSLDAGHQITEVGL